MQFDRGRKFSLVAQTGTMAAALAANSPIFGLRMSPPNSGVMRALVEKMRLHWNCVAAFTTPITAGRSLSVVRGSGAALSGGAAVATIAKKRSLSAASFAGSADGGDVRIATTATLTQVGVTLETDEQWRVPLTHLGAAGAYGLFEKVWDPEKGDEFILEPGELLAIKNPQLMDAVGTWQLTVELEWRELAAANAIV